MPLMNWTAEKYGVQVDFADHEHQNVFNKLNILYALSKGGAEHELVEVQLAYLIDYVEAHFAHEEREMLAKNFDGYQAHKNDHTMLIDTSRQLQAKFKENVVEITERICFLIKSWFDNHIPVFDRQYSEALNSQELQVEPGSLTQ
jgi:hemerythrin